MRKTLRRVRGALALAGLLATGVLMAATLGVSHPSAAPPTTTTPGQSGTNPGSPGDDCSHGNSGQPCKPDPQPGHGSECDDHGNASGNEDHCAAVPTTSTVQTTTTVPTTTRLTSSTTTSQTTTTTSQTSSNVSTTTNSTGTTTAAPATTPDATPTTTSPGASGVTDALGTVVIAAAKPPEKLTARQHKRQLAAWNAGELPNTGLPIWLIAAIGAGLVVAGGMLFACGLSRAAARGDLLHYEDRL